MKDPTIQATNTVSPILMPAVYYSTSIDQRPAEQRATLYRLAWPDERARTALFMFVRDPGGYLMVELRLNGGIGLRVEAGDIPIAGPYFKLENFMMREFVDAFYVPVRRFPNRPPPQVLRLRDPVEGVDWPCEDVIGPRERHARQELMRQKLAALAEARARRAPSIYVQHDATEEPA